MSRPSIAIFGGNGFLGLALVRHGVKRGYDVLAISRRGEPPAGIEAQPWASSVQWLKGNIFEPNTYADKLKGVDTVVHSIGLLFEDPRYKKIANSNLKLVDDIAQTISWAALKGSNPMDRSYYHTYEAVQRDLAVVLADTFVQANPDKGHTMVYISADSQPPLVPLDYLTTKREAEFELLNKPDLRAILMRPGFMYDAHSHHFANRDIVKGVLQIGYSIKDCLFGNKIKALNNAIKPPVLTDQVAEAMYAKIELGTLGVVPLDEIKKFKA